MVETQTYEFEFAMNCDGCSNAAKRVLAKLGDPIQKVDADLQKQRLFVTTTLAVDAVKSQLEKTGKEAKLVASHQN